MVEDFNSNHLTNHEEEPEPDEDTELILATYDSANLRFARRGCMCIGNPRTCRPIHPPGSDRHQIQPANKADWGRHCHLGSAGRSQPT